MQSSQREIVDVHVSICGFEVYVMGCGVRVGIPLQELNWMDGWWSVMLYCRNEVLEKLRECGGRSKCVNEIMK